MKVILLDSIIDTELILSIEEIQHHTPGNIPETNFRGATFTVTFLDTNWKTISQNWCQHYGFHIQKVHDDLVRIWSHHQSKIPKMGKL